MVELSIYLTVLGGWTLLTYRLFALGAGFPVGEIFYKDWPIILGGISVLGAAYSAFSQLGFLWAIGIVLAGILSSFVSLVLLKSWSGMLAFVFVIVGYLFLFFV